MSDKPTYKDQSNMLVQFPMQTIGLEIYVCHTHYYVVVKRALSTFNKWETFKGSSNFKEVVFRQKRDHQDGMQTGIYRINTKEEALTYLQESDNEVTEFTKDGITKLMVFKERKGTLMPRLVAMQVYSDGFLLNKLGRITGFFFDCDIPNLKKYLPRQGESLRLTSYPYHVNWSPVNPIVQMVADHHQPAT